jgi:cyclic pyranopterin phosphate synthase
VLIEKLASLRVGGDGPPVDLAMTTNGATLRLLASDLRAAGLKRINISCDSLRRDRFLAMTRRDALAQVLDGIDVALEVGFDPVKLNVVLMRGVNDDEIVGLATFGRERGITVRFIEFMPLDASDEWGSNRVVPGQEVVATIDAVYPLVPTVDRGTSPAERFAYRDGKGEVGVIASVTQSFCGACDRVRITAEGQFRNCLFAVQETDLRAILRGGGTDDDLARAIATDVAGKWAGHSIGQVHFIKPARTMSQIGG